MSRSLALARSIIEAEAAALAALAGHLDEGFHVASDLLWNCAGRVIVTGMGKAGLIGQKIAATLRSTGTSASFLDPAAAAHGDMGLIGSGDAILALSNSGETDEVLAVARWVVDRGHGLIAITSRPESALAGMASVLLGLPAVPEGCPIGKAPMASSAMMLALGDALAAELMMRRGFSAADFLLLHHGGYLGRVRAAA